MRIGLDAQRIFRPNLHGMEVVAIETIKALQEVDHENEYIVYVKTDTGKVDLINSQNFTLKQIPAYSYPDWEQYRLVKEANKDGVDLLHCMSNTGPHFFSGKMILTLHDIIYMEKLKFSGNSYQDFGNVYRRLIVPKVVAKSELIFTVSNFEKDKIVDFFKINPQRVIVLYNGVNPIFNRNHRVSESSITNGFPETYMLFLGNTAPKKNTINLLKAYYHYCKHTSDIIPLVIPDLGANYLKSSLSSEVLTTIKDYLIFLDYVPYEQMPDLYRKASFFIYPSLRESFGMPILESMACGTPVITSNTTSMPEVAGGNALLCNPHDVLDIADKITTMAGDGNQRETLTKKGLAWSENFSWQNTAKKLYNEYQKMNRCSSS